MPILVFDDLDYFPRDATIEAIQDVTLPLAGNGSVRVRRVAGDTAPSLNFVPKIAFSQGATRGRLRAHMRSALAPVESLSWGLACMQSQRQISAGTGNAYGLRLGYRNAGADGFLELVKYTGGLPSEGATLATTPLTPGTTLNCLQLEWLTSPDVGGVALVGWHGVAADFSDLAILLLTQDVDAPFTTTVTEGGFVACFGSFDNIDIRFDQMRLEGPPL